MNLIKVIEQDFIIDRLTDSILNTISGDSFQTEISFQKGYDGFVAFTAKTQLIEHYENTLGAYHFKNQRMIIDTKAAKLLVDKYFKTQ